MIYAHPKIYELIQRLITEHKHSEANISDRRMANVSVFTATGSRIAQRRRRRLRRIMAMRNRKQGIDISRAIPINNGATEWSHGLYHYESKLRCGSPSFLVICRTYIRHDIRARITFNEVWGCCRRCCCQCEWRRKAMQEICIIIILRSRCWMPPCGRTYVTYCCNMFVSLISNLAVCVSVINCCCCV